MRQGVAHVAHSDINRTYIVMQRQCRKDFLDTLYIQCVLKSVCVVIIPYTYLFPTHSDICVLVKGPWTLASSVFSHLYSHITESTTAAPAAAAAVVVAVAEEEWVGSSENMSTGSAVGTVG